MGNSALHISTEVACQRYCIHAWASTYHRCGGNVVVPHANVHRPSYIDRFPHIITCKETSAILKPKDSFKYSKVNWKVLPWLALTCKHSFLKSMNHAV